MRSPTKLTRKRENVGSMERIWRNILLFPGALIFFVVILAKTSSADTPNESIAEVLNSTIKAIILSATNIGANEVCKLTLPKVFCDIVVKPVISTLYQQATFLKPKDDDDPETMRAKAEAAGHYLETHEELQRMMIVQFSLLKENQAAIMEEIRGLGKSQKEMQASIQHLIFGQRRIEDKVDSIAEFNEYDRDQKVVEKRMEALLLAETIISRYRELDSLEKRINELRGEEGRSDRINRQIEDFKKVVEKIQSEEFASEFSSGTPEQRESFLNRLRNWNNGVEYDIRRWERQIDDLKR